MLNIPYYISLIFILTTFLTVGFFYFASNKSSLVLLIILGWMALQFLIANTGFYQNTSTVPPRFLIMVLPPVLLILGLFLTKSGKNFIEGLNLKTLTLLSIIRIPVEFVLLFLFLNQAIPQLMTFEGRNFDILAGITAPIMYFVGFKNNIPNKRLLLWWNIICLILLINIVVNAALSAPSPIQQFAFDSPNLAILQFPFNWLPSVVVPIVLFSHFVAIRRLSVGKNSA